MFLGALEAIFLLFSLWAVAYEIWTCKRWPKDSLHFLLISVGLGIVLLLTGAV